MTTAGAVSTASDLSLVRRFAEKLDRLNPGGGRIGLAVSGGPDSMAMLLLAHQAVPGGFEVATVDHGLRAEAADECVLVANACADRDIPCAVLRVEIGGGNVQARARRARYDALGQWAARRSLACVATAHHADDQAETVLMRLNRASGIEGLAGIRAQLEMPFDGLGPGTSFRLIRPLLAERRCDLHALLASSGQPFARDPSNEDEGFDRVRMRKALAQADWLDPAAIAASAGHLADAADALNRAFRQFYDANVRRVMDGGEVAVWLTVPADAPRYFVQQAVDVTLRSVGGDPRGGDVARLVAMLEQGRGGNVAGVLATVQDGEYYFRREPPRRNV